MADEEAGPAPRRNDDRVQAWLKNQERDPEAQADSKALTVIPARGAGMPQHLTVVLHVAKKSACCSSGSDVLLTCFNLCPVKPSITQSSVHIAADSKGAKADAGQPAQTYKAPAYNAADVEKGMLTKQKQPLGEEPREFIRFK